MPENLSIKTPKLPYILKDHQKFSNNPHGNVFANKIIILVILK